MRFILIFSYYLYDLGLQTVLDGGPSYDAAARFLKGPCELDYTTATTPIITTVSGATNQQTTTEIATTEQTTTEIATTEQTTTEVGTTALTTNEATQEQTTTEATTAQTTNEATTGETTEATTAQTTTEDTTTAQTTSDVTTEPVTIANITDGPNGKPAVCFLPFQATMRCKNLQQNLFHAITNLFNSEQSPLIYL